MGNAAGKLSVCFNGGGGTASMCLPGQDLSVFLTEPLDEGLGHSFCYVRPDPAQTSLSKVHSEEAAADATTFWAISGASVSANTSTPPFDVSC
ncbi:hypothetical protein MLD38_017348 [Melastoma candidum]|uniref:Uncharacterized protein n=1 Tax=Melastoma candidum TaxID=119954 RepID=A0ACB9QPJ5_9MYRT|nr:hypothetical protein MLD38_017348 [Melastoma candidum]